MKRLVRTSPRRTLYQPPHKRCLFCLCKSRCFLFELFNIFSGSLLATTRFDDTMHCYYACHSNSTSFDIVRLPDLLYFHWRIFLLYIFYFPAKPWDFGSPLEQAVTSFYQVTALFSSNSDYEPNASYYRCPKTCVNYVELI